MAAKGVPERIKQLKANLGYIKPGKLIEFGCGSGQVLQMLSEAFPDSLVIGVDISEDALQKAKRRSLKNVTLIRADVTQRVLRGGCVDTVLFVGSMHELYSFLGELQVVSSLKIASEILRKGSVLVVWDFLKPRSKQVEIGFKREEIRRRFEGFAQEFEPRKVGFIETEQGVSLDIVDAVEFITKYRSPTLKDWKFEMKEVHFFFSMEDYKQVLKGVGFKIVAVEDSSPSEEWWSEIREDIECDFEAESINVLIIAER